MGGRIAEEIKFNEQTSGASSDIRVATKMARRMVCDWGMSRLGPLAFGENQEHIFLGKEIAREQNYSERTAQQIDDTISEIVQEQYKRAQAILKEKENCLEILAQALLQYETLEGKYVYEIVKEGALISKIPEEKSAEIKPEVEIVPNQEEKNA